VKIDIPRFAPDAARFDGTFTAGHKNVLPKVEGYGPMPSLEAYSAAIGADCRGAFAAHKGDGSYEMYAASASNLYRLSGTTWNEISKSTGAYNCSSEEYWDFTQWRDKLVAVNVNDPPQVVDVGTANDFADLGGSPPQARYSAVMGPHLVLGNILNAEEDVAWSAVNNITGWTVRIDGAGRQTIPDGGIVRGVVGFQSGGYIFNETSIRAMEWLPASSAQFRIYRYDLRRGLMTPHAHVKAGRDIYFLAEDGFYRLGSPSEPIGAERVNRWFQSDVDKSNLNLINTAMDPVNKIVLWAYNSVNSTGSTNCDRVIGYDWELKEWFIFDVDTQFIFAAATANQTLEQIGAAYPGGLETIPFSLDSSVWKGGRPLLAAFDTDQKLGFFNGANMEATLATNDVDVFKEERVAKIKGFTPITNASTVYGRIGTRQRHSDPTVWTASAGVNSFGKIELRTRGRTIAIETKIPAGEEWMCIEGWVPDVRKGGRR
jgi:hypothetical protein